MRIQRRGWALVASLAVAVAAFAVVASTATSAPRHATVANTAAIDWNNIAITTVRGESPALFQLEGLIYMSYVQASVYDAVVKIEGRYKPYHNFHSPVSTDGASAEAAVAAAAYTALVKYFPDKTTSLTAAYQSYLQGLPVAGQAAGVLIGQAAASDIIALRANDGRNAVITTPYGQGPNPPTEQTAGVWIFAPPPSLQSAQIPWAAFMQPFMLKSPVAVPGRPAARHHEPQVHGAARGAQGVRRVQQPGADSGGDGDRAVLERERDQPDAAVSP